MANKIDPDEIRKRRNADIVKRFKMGDPLQGKASETWYPLRPTIQKDMVAMAKLYGQEHEWDETGKCKKCGLLKTQWEQNGQLCPKGGK